MNFLGNLWDVIWFFFWTFAFITYLMAIFNVIGDIFRDHTLKGGFKAIWILFLVFVPFLTVLAYLISRGAGMAERQRAAATQANKAAESYLKEVVGSSPADEITKAQALLAAGTITDAEFATLKARALA